MSDLDATSDPSPDVAALINASGHTQADAELIMRHLRQAGWVLTRPVNGYAKWSEEDRKWVGFCDDAPGLSWLASSAPEAIAGIEALVLGALQDD